MNQVQLLVILKVVEKTNILKEGIISWNSNRPVLCQNPRLLCLYAFAKNVFRHIALISLPENCKETLDKSPLEDIIV